MVTKLRNKVTGEILNTGYVLECAYEPWEIIRDSRSEKSIEKLYTMIDVLNTTNPIKLDYTKA